MLILYIILGYIIYVFCEKLFFSDTSVQQQTKYSSPNVHTAEITSHSKNTKFEVIFFDTETNGISKKYSVLSISAIKAYVDYQKRTVQIVDKYERFYYPVENFSTEAVAINHLDFNNITRCRNGCNYPKYFKDDQDSFLDFIGNAKHFVAHNIEFDRKFLSFTLSHQFCTMKSNICIVKQRFKNNRGGYKYPSLAETADFYRIYTGSTDFHSSSYDVLVTLKIFQTMLINGYASSQIRSFLID